MKKYMVITMVDGEQHAKFFDTPSEAEEYRMNCECGVGGYAEVYMRLKDHYMFMYC